MSVKDYSVRMGLATCLPALARSLGCDPAAALDAADMDESMFASPETRVPVRNLAKFASAVADMTGRPDLGLLIANAYGSHGLGSILTLAQEGPDVRAALLNISRLLKHHNEFAYLSLSELESDAVLSYELRETEFEGANIVLVTALSHALRVMRRFCGMGWCPAEVRLTMARPKDVKPYETFFGAKVCFGGTMDALVFPRHWLDERVAPEPGSSGSGLLPSSAWDFPDHVRLQIVMRMGLQPVTALGVAATMGLSRRTLDRRLLEFGTSFGELLDEIRFARARRLLAVGNVMLSDISMALGYAELSAFSRAFRKWAGCTPQRWRQSQQKSPSHTRHAIRGQ